MGGARQQDQAVEMARSAAAARCSGPLLCRRAPALTSCVTGGRVLISLSLDPSERSLGRFRPWDTVCVQ